MLSNRHFRHGLKRTKKAIPRIKKATKGIAISIMMIMVGGSVSSLLFSWAGLIPFAAGIGGLIVFLGLWIEKEADEEKGNLTGRSAPKLKWLKFKSELGWWLLMSGIFIEISTGIGLAIREQIKEAQANPLNQPIRTIKANIKLYGIGTNESHAIFIGGWTANRVPMVRLLVGKSASISSGWAVSLPCSSCDDSDLFVTNGTLHKMARSWTLYFDSDRGGMIDPIIPESNRVKDAFQWDTVELDMSSLPRACEIIGGSVILVVNSKVFSFPIPPQTAKITDLTNWMVRGAFLQYPKTNSVTIVTP